MSSKIVGTRMRPDNRSSKDIFEALMAEPDRPRFGFGAKLALVNVDLQRAYTRIDEYETAYETDPHQIDHINRLASLARAKGMPVIWTRVGYMAGGGDSGVWGSRDSSEGSRRSITEGSRRHELDERCDVDAERDAIYTKRMPSAFFETPLASWLTWHKVDTVVVTGGATSNCVRATVVDSVSHGYRTIVPLECVADANAAAHYANLVDIELDYADVEPMQTVIDWLERQPDV